MENSNSLTSLFGWTKIAEQAPLKIPTFDHIFKPIKNTNHKIAVCYDGSGSTTFNGTKSFDNKSFSEIYAEALLILQDSLPSHEIICWSTIAKKIDSEKDVFKNAIDNKIPFAQVISDMNAGTEPQHILPLVKTYSTVIITDGEIDQRAITTIQQNMPTSDIGPVFLIIIPHIDSYQNLYKNSESETNAMDHIRLSIPQAFSGRLATVVVWNYKKKIFELIQELTAPWAKNGSSLNELLNKSLPIIPNGEFLVEKEGKYESFVLENLIDWFLNNPVDESSINKLIELNIRDSIRQQASQTQKDKWNNCVQQLFNKILSVKVKNEFTEKKIPENTSITEIIKMTRMNEIERKNIEKKYKDSLGKICEKLLIDKTVGEITNIASARVAQTRMNVNAFQTLNNEDKLDELAPALVSGNCSICEQTNVNIFKTISVPAKLFIYLPMCKNDRIIKGKKGKTQTISSLDIDYLKSVLDDSKPRFHCTDLCVGCAKICLEKARLPDDMENISISNLVPQNIVTDHSGQRVVTHRLIILPMVEPNSIHNCLDVNEKKISFCRQWLRGFISKITGLEPATQECMKVCLAFLSKMAFDKPSAELVYATMVSLLSGGAQNRFMDLTGRLFHPNTKPLSSDALTIICLTENVVELTERKILPESNKLLLLCLLDRQISPLIIAKNLREKTLGLLFRTLNEVIKKENAMLVNNFGITNENLAIIQNFNTPSDFKDSNEELFNKFLGTYLQNIMGVDFQQITGKERQITDIFGSNNVDDLSKALHLNNEYLTRMIQRSNMSIEDFLNMTPKFLKELIDNNNKDKMNIYQKFL